MNELKHLQTLRGSFSAVSTTICVCNHLLAGMIGNILTRSPKCTCFSSFRPQNSNSNDRPMLLFQHEFEKTNLIERSQLVMLMLKFDGILSEFRDNFQKNLMEKYGANII